MPHHGVCIHDMVYPRVGGGNLLPELNANINQGLSPRGRGKPICEVWIIEQKRSIPAWAGETQSGQSPRGAGRVYPRVGGGNMKTTTTRHKHEGLSPRGRGKPRFLVVGIVLARSIPAWAGETSSFQSPGRQCAVYPRVGGGNASRAWRIRNRRGLSPRGRGKRPNTDNHAFQYGSIPAWAGETNGAAAYFP